MKIAQRSDRVYVTTDRNLARAWAGIWTIDGKQHGGGTLYQVEVDVDELEPDDDLLSLPGRFFQAPQARVTCVYDAYVGFHDRFGRVIQQLVDEHAAAKLRRAREADSDASPS